MMQSLAKSDIKPATDPNSEAPTSDTKPATDPDAAPLFALVSELANYIQRNPGLTPNAVDQEMTRLLKQGFPDYSIELSNKYLVVGQTKQLLDAMGAPASSTKVLMNLDNCYFEVGQFITQWGDEISKKPDDEDNQW